MKFKKVKGLIPRFLKRRPPESGGEVNLTHPIHFTQLNPKIKFLSGQLLRLDSGVSLLRYNFSLAAESFCVPFVAKNQMGEAIFAWHFKKLEVETFLELFAQFEVIQKKAKSVYSQIPELQGLENRAPKFWIVTQAVNSELEPLLPYLRGMNFELFRLKITRRGSNAVVSIQKLIHASFLELPRKSEIPPKAKVNLATNLPPSRPEPANVEKINQFSLLLDAQQVEALPKIKAVKKPTPFRRASITQEEMKDFLSMEDAGFSEEDDVTDPFISLENLREPTRRFMRSTSLGS
ncbi:MAG: hypothetical protein HQM15_07390 [Deltaproteobacteria bacterium]|nr:hypothetical protein [Deltaproteobacteria bacterium]